MNSGRKFLLTDLLYLKVFTAFASGIFCAEYVQNKALLFCIPFLVFTGFIILYRLIQSPRPKYADSAIFSLILFAGIGWHAFFLYQSYETKNQIEPFIGKESIIFLRLDETPIQKKKSFKLTGKVLQVGEADKLIKTSSKIIAYVPLEFVNQKADIGDIFQLKGKLSEPRAPHYDFEFDYGKWLSRKSIFFTIYSRDFQYIKSDKSLLYRIKSFPKRCQAYFESQIDHYILEPQSNDIAKSILIGVKNDIDRDLYSAYANTGTIHILSISGLHFGILLLFLDKMLSVFIKNRKLKFSIKYSIAFIYALITGFNAPIMRSFLMFLFLDIAKLSKVKTSSFNILFLSAWIILLIDTNQIFNIGFQFSYMALTGILLIYPRTVWKIQFDNYISNFAWKSAITMTSAWLFTIPLTVFYFQKLSLIGLLSNFVAVPMVTGIMYIGFGFLVFSLASDVGILFGKILSFLINIQNQIILWFNELPYASIEGLYMDKTMLFITLLSLGFFVFFIRLKDKMSLRFLLTSISIFIIISSFKSYQTCQKSEWFLNSSYQYSTVAYKEKNNLFLFVDSIEENTETFFLNSLKSKYKIENIYRYPSQDYIQSSPVKYSTNLKAKPEYFLLCRENKEHWNSAISSRDSFILMPNLGYKKETLISLLESKDKYYRAY